MQEILVFGGSGLVGSRFVEQLSNRFIVKAPGHQDLDLLDQNAVSQFLSNSKAQLIINFVAFTNVDLAEEQRGDEDGLTYKLNVKVPQILVSATQETGQHLLQLSTDYVFDGTESRQPYTEVDIPSPLNWYGKTKWLGDQAVLESGLKSTIARIEMPYTGRNFKRKDLARVLHERLQNNQPIKGIVDQKITPNYIDTLILALAKIIEDPQPGIFNIASTDWTTPFDFARLIAQTFGLDQSLITEVSFAEYQRDRRTPRPQYSWLDVTKFQNQYGQEILVSNAEGIKRFKSQIDELI